MSRIEQACPRPAETRAEHCASCCELNGALTPCVSAWLRASVVPLRIVQAAHLEPRQGTSRAA